ncbi:MAG: DHA2 family efflux MFS transporter permease subunit [Candidatus Saccharibacteria bacterium]
MTHAEPERVDWTILIVIIIGTFMAVLNTSIVNVALPKIMAVFNATADDSQWILSSYMMALGVVMPITGYLGDTYGYKRMYSVALGIFVLGSALCGLSWNINSLIAARVLQAIGGGIMQPLGMAFVYRTTPKSQLGFVLGIYGIAAMAAPAIGPTLGGYIVEYISWRLIFYINVPIGIVNLFLASMMLRETQLIKGEHFDYWGLFTSATGLGCLLMALSRGNTYGWTSVYILSLLLVAAVTLTAFIFIELKHPEPLLELRLFNNFIFSASTVVGAILNIGMFSAMFLMPLLLQNVIGISAMKSGLLLLPPALATAFIMPISGKLYDKYGVRGIGMVGLFILSYTTYLMSSFNDLTSFGSMIEILSIRGFGLGLCMIPISVIGMATVPLHLVGKGSALGNVVRQVAGSLGIAMFTAIMQHRQVFHFTNLAQSVNFNSNEGLILSSVMKDIAVSLGTSASSIQVLTISAVMKRIGTLSMINAISDCYIIAAAICFVACLLTYFLQQPKAHSVKKEVVIEIESEAALMEG